MDTKKIIIFAALQALLLALTPAYANDENTTDANASAGLAVDGNTLVSDSNVTEASDNNDTGDAIPEGHIANEPTRVKEFPQGELSYSFTPDFKSIYAINLIGINDSCNSSNVDSTTLPPSSRFRQSHDREAQTRNEMIVHVYDVPLGEMSEDEARAEYFTAPFKVCLTGMHTVARSLYLRKAGINTGVMLIPFKSYGGDVFSNSSAGGYISYQNDIVHWLGTVGISQISVSTSGDSTTNTDAGIESQIGIMLAGGLAVEIVRNWDLSVLVGFDHLLSSDSAAEWEHQDRPWVALGVGLNLTR